MAALFQWLTKARRLSFLAVLLLFCFPPATDARAVSCNAAGFRQAINEQLKEEQPITGESACTGVLPRAGQVCNGLLCAADPVNGVDPSGHLMVATDVTIATALNFTLTTKQIAVVAAVGTFALGAAVVLANTLEDNLDDQLTVMEVEEFAEHIRGEKRPTREEFDALQERVNDRRRRKVQLFFRYDRFADQVSFPPRTDVTTRGDLKWSEALNITYSRDVDVLYMYTLITKSAEYQIHPNGIWVAAGIPQYQLTKTVGPPRVILTRTLRKGDE